MSLRLTAPSEDILGANYKITKIVASDYNPNIDSTITVTVTVKDVYDDPVENESVQVKGKYYSNQIRVLHKAM